LKVCLEHKREPAYPVATYPVATYPVATYPGATYPGAMYFPELDDLNFRNKRLSYGICRFYGP
jgi:hypothetical protein